MSRLQYDANSYQLAKAFLEDNVNRPTLKETHNLAVVIQQTITDWFEDNIHPERLK